MRSDIRLKPTSSRRPKAGSVHVYLPDVARRKVVVPPAAPESIPDTPFLPPVNDAQIWPAPDVGVTVPARKWPALHTAWPTFRRAAIAATALAVVVGLGARASAQGQQVKSQVDSSISVAKTSAAAARQSLSSGQYSAAKQQFGVTKEALHRATQTLAEHGQLGNSAGSFGRHRGTITLGSDLLTSGELLAGSGEQLAGDLEAVTAGVAAKGGDPLKAGEVVISELPKIQSHLTEARGRVELLSAVVAESRHTGSGELKTATDQLDQTLPTLTKGLDQAEEAVGLVPSLLGTDRFKQYVLLFQNPAELRATGGFVGTYGRLTVDNGVVNELLVDSIYNPANQANSVIKEQAPVPYRRFYGEGQNPIWGMQDANWSPDFATSARKFQQFYEASGGPTTDGVIGVTVNPIVATLKVVGPIELPEYGYVLDADNFQQLIQADQLERAGENDVDPKKILRDFTPKLLAKIGTAPPEQRAAIFKIFKDAINQRDLTFYFGDDQAQQLAASGGAAGRLPQSPAGLSVIDSNIAGHKSSNDVKTTVNQKIVIERNGRMTVELTIARLHTAVTSLDDNSNFTRIFVPKGSQLAGSAGFADVAPVNSEEQDGFTVIGGWTDLVPGQERTVVVRYNLPRKLDLSKGELPLLYTKQGGTTVTVNRTVTLPSGYRWEPGSGATDGQTLRLSETARTDLNHLLRFRNTR